MNFGGKLILKILFLGAVAAVYLYFWKILFSCIIILGVYYIWRQS